jgi:phosphate transport system permease protein
MTAPVEVDLVGILSRGRRVKNRLATALMAGALLVAAIPLVVVLVFLVVKGFHLVWSTSWWTKDIPTNLAAADLADKAEYFGVEPSAASVPAVVHGMWPAIYGTLLITGLAALFSIPVGILAAVYLHEYGGKGRLARVIRFFSDVMVGVPSVVMGIFLYTIWVVPLGRGGRSALAGSLALACLMLPMVVRSTEEMLRLVPDPLRHASSALGSPRWRTITKVVLPAALPGITSGCMLAIARAAGETAPILFAIGSVTAVNWSLLGQNTALSSQIYNNATQPGGADTAWGAALTLILIVMVLTLFARFVTKRFSIDVAG